MVLMGVSIERPLFSLPSFICHLGPREHELSFAKELLAAFVLLFLFVVDFPELNQLVICGQELRLRLGEGVDPLDGVDLLRDLSRVEGVKGYLVTLELSQIVKIHLSTFFYLLEDYNPTAPISDTEQLPMLVKFNRAQEVLLGDVSRVWLSQSGQVGPL
jgi:hypothetical protein